MMIKLLYITNGINGSGGLERVLSIKASILADEYGYDVYILSLNHGHLNPFYNFSPRIKFKAIHVSTNPLLFYINYRIGVQNAVKEIQPDIISVCDDGLKGFSIPTIINTRAKIIYERHASIHLNIPNSPRGRIINYFVQRQVPKFNKFIVLTPGNCREWKANNVTVIPNPLSFTSTSHNPLDQNRIIVVGSHSWNKGYDLLLNMWKLLENQFPEWRLDIYGKIDANRTFVKLAEEYQLKNVNFHNPVKNIQSEYEHSSILALTSRSEGFGMVLIEAMECGVPCIAFDCPAGPGDIISHGKDGFLVPELNTNEFVERLKDLMQRHELRTTLGANAKRSAYRYSALEIVKQWDELFNKITIG